MLMKLIKNIFKKPEPVKRDKRELTQAEKIGLMSEEERMSYYYELSVKNNNKTVIEMALEQEEKRQGNYLMHFEFSPKKQNYINVRSLLQFYEKQNGLKHKLWKYIRDFTEEKAGGKCIICGASGLDYMKEDPDNKGEFIPMYSTATEAHEVWKYERRVLEKDTVLINGTSRYKLKAGKQVYVQKLIRIEALEQMCHGTKHINRSYQNKGEFENLKSYYSLLNSVDLEQTERDLETAQDKQKVLDKTYLLDCSELLKMGFSDEINEALREAEVDVLFNPHSEQFQKFINIEFISKGEKDNG